MKDKELTWLQLEYSWRWFEFHAEQRLKAFYYFLVIIGFLWYGYISNFVQGAPLLKILLCIGGACVSLAFLQIEKRNENLVGFARDELDKLETEIGVEIRKKDRQDKEKRYFIPISHRFWLRFIYVISLLIFLVSLLIDIRIIKILECIQKCFFS